MANQLEAIFDAPLTQASSMLQPQGLISDLICPRVQVVQYTGSLAKYGNQHLRIETSIIGGTGPSRRVSAVTRSDSNYSIVSHGLHDIVTRRDYANVVNPYDAELDATIGVASKIKLEKERVVAVALAATGTVTQNTTLSGTSQWSDADNSDPISVVTTGIAAIKDGCGVSANIGWADVRVANKLRYHPQLLDMLGFKYAQPGGLSNDDIAKAFGLQKFFVADCDYNSADEGASDSLAAVWGKHFWLAVSPPSAALRQMSWGYLLEMANGGMKTYKIPQDDPAGSTKILVEDEYQHFLANVGAIYLVKDAIA